MKTSAVPCPDGKFRKVSTHRCKTIRANSPYLSAMRRKIMRRAVTGASPCSPGKFRKASTHRCKTRPCSGGKRRSLETGRCVSSPSRKRSLSGGKLPYKVKVSHAEPGNHVKMAHVAIAIERCLASHFKVSPKKSAAKKSAAKDGSYMNILRAAAGIAGTKSNAIRAKKHANLARKLSARVKKSA